MHVALEVSQLSLDPRDGRAVLLLSHAPSQRVFPLWLDDKDAASVARACADKHALPPDSQDLLSSIIDIVGCRVEHVALVGVTGGVVRARIALSYGDDVTRLDARASDAIALAVRGHAPILVEDELLEQVSARVREAEARVSHPHATAAEPVAQTAGERWNQLLEHLSTGPEGPLYEA